MSLKNFNNAKEKQLILLEKEDVRQYWDLVQPGLIELLKEKDSPDGWNIPEMYASITSGKATLIFTSISRTPGMCYPNVDAAIKDACGFAVVQVLTNFAERSLHIWVAASNEHTNKGGAGSILKNFNEEITELAQNCGCQALTFSSNREFWYDVAPRYDFEVSTVWWKRKV